MIIDSPHKHLTDQEFFTHIKLFNLIFENGKVKNDYEYEDAFRLSDLSIGNEEASSVFNRISLGADILNVTVNIKGGSDKGKELIEAKSKTETRPTKDRAGILKIIKDIEGRKKVKFNDAGKVSWVWYEIYPLIRFTPLEYKIPAEIETIFRMELGKYLDNYINDKLAISTNNFYKFETQKRVLIGLIEKGKMIGLYGNNFIIKEKMDGDCILERFPEFSIIQTSYALQKLGYLKVVDVWDSSEYPKNISSYRDPERFLHVNIILEDGFIREINDSYKKDNPKNIINKFDETRGILKFADQDIELSKNGKQTDAVLLMKTLMSANGDDWKHNDEILEDWGYNEDNQKVVPKNKVYFAGQKINTAVALKTKIEDLIECNTSKARINPKYRKVDE